MNWKKKLSSRKFWAALANFVGMLVIALGFAQETATQVTALIMAGAAVVAYIVGEGLIDAASANTPHFDFYDGFDDDEEKPPEAETSEG